MGAVGLKHATIGYACNISDRPLFILMRAGLVAGANTVDHVSFSQLGLMEVPAGFCSEASLLCHPSRWLITLIVFTW